MEVPILPKKQPIAKSLNSKVTSTTPRSTNSLSNGRNATGDTAAKPLSAAALKREAQRQKLQEIKRKNREAMALAKSMAPPADSAEPSREPITFDL